MSDIIERLAAAAQEAVQEIKILKHENENYRRIITNLRAELGRRKLGK